MHQLIVCPATAQVERFYHHAADPFATVERKKGLMGWLSRTLKGS